MKLQGPERAAQGKAYQRYELTLKVQIDVPEGLTPITGPGGEITGFLSESGVKIEPQGVVFRVTARRGELQEVHESQSAQVLAEGLDFWVLTQMAAIVRSGAAAGQAENCGAAPDN